MPQSEEKTNTAAVEDLKDLPKAVNFAIQNPAKVDIEFKRNILRRITSSE